MRRLLRLLPLTLLIVIVAPGPAGAAGAGSTLLVSRADGLRPVPPAYDGFSSPGAVTPDGRYVVFTTSASGFADGTTDPDAEALLLRDRQTGATTLVGRSDGVNGIQANADVVRSAVSVGADGHVLVAFDTRASNLVDRDTGPVALPRDTDEVWLRDATAGTTRLVSRAGGAAGAPADRGAAVGGIDVTAGGPVVGF